MGSGLGLGLGLGLEGGGLEEGDGHIVQLDLDTALAREDRHLVGVGK